MRIEQTWVTINKIEIISPIPGKGFYKEWVNIESGGLDRQAVSQLLRFMEIQVGVSKQISIFSRNFISSHVPIDPV